VAHELARALNVTPWEALLGEVRRSAGGVAFLDRKVAEAPSDDALLQVTDPETGRPGYAPWVKLRMVERQHLARVSKMAVDAGVAQELVARFALQGESVARLVANIERGLAEAGLGLSVEQRELVDGLLGRELLQLEATATGDRIIDAEVVDVEARRNG
jgi:predicted transcriptional regulator